MNLRRTLAIVATSLVALTATIAPAQTQNTGDLVAGNAAINAVIDNLDCGALKTTLYTSNFATAQTTRSELAVTLKTSANLAAIDPILGVAGALYAGRIADRAVVCGAVQPDPEQDILTQLQNLSSNLSS